MHDVLNLLGKFWNLVDFLIVIVHRPERLGTQRHRLINVIFVLEDLNDVLSDFLLNIAHVDVDVAPGLICGEDQSVVHLEWLRVLDDLTEMLTPLHVVFTSVRVMGDVSNLFIVANFVILSPLQEVIHVFIIFVVHDNVTVFLSQLENYVALLVVLLVVRIDQHKLAVIRHVVILVHLHVVIVLGAPYGYQVLLNQELRVLMNKERRHIFILPLAIVVRIIQVTDMLQLVLIVACVNYRLLMKLQILRAAENVSAEWINCHESIEAALLVSPFDVSNLLNGLFEILHFSAILLDWHGCILHAKHFEPLCLISLLV